MRNFISEDDIEQAILQKLEGDPFQYSLSSLAQLLTGSKYSVAGPRYFKYKGEWLNDIRHRLEG